MARAIVTLAVGEKCFHPWDSFLRAGWMSWCRKHNYELVVFDHLLDTSSKGRNRSPAWQKLLAMSSPEIQSFEQVLWLDADVFISPEAPDPLYEVSTEVVAMVLDSGSPLSGDPEWFCRCWSQILVSSLKISEPTFAKGLFSYLDLWGFDARRKPLWNSGVIGFSPKHHSQLFANIYENWIDGGPGSLHEMIPLNLELQQRYLLHELNPRFNFLFGVHQAVWQLVPKHVQNLHGLGEEKIDSETLAKSLAERNFFIHFAGAHKQMFYLLSNGILG